MSGNAVELNFGDDARHDAKPIRLRTLVNQEVLFKTLAASADGLATVGINAHANHAIIVNGKIVEQALVSSDQATFHMQVKFCDELGGEFLLIHR